jgi:hypothetical protein
MELHNLHCQVINSKAFVGELKVKSTIITCLFVPSSKNSHPTIDQKQESGSFMVGAKSSGDDSRPWILFTQNVLVVHNIQRN